MGRGSLVPSQLLIRTLSQQRDSDAVVQFLRALAASHMLANAEHFEYSFQLQFEGQKERSVATVQQPVQPRSVCTCVTHDTCAYVHVLAVSESCNACKLVHKLWD